MAKAAAKQEKKPEAAEAEEAPKKKGKLPLIIGLAVALAAAGGGGAAWFFMSKKGGDSHKEAAHAPKPPVFVPLDPFTVNLGQGEQYLQVSATLKVLDPLASDQVKQYMPEIRHKVLSLLASKKAPDISSGEARERLSEEIRQVTNNILLAAAGKPTRPIGAPPAPAEAKPETAEDPGQGEAKPDGEAKADGEAKSGEAAGAPKSAAAVATAAPEDPVQSVFFTSFIIQ